MNLYRANTMLTEAWFAIDENKPSLAQLNLQGLKVIGIYNPSINEVLNLVKRGGWRKYKDYCLVTLQRLIININEEILAYEMSCMYG